jgi:hypothetical protein
LSPRTTRWLLLLSPYGLALLAWLAAFVLPPVAAGLVFLSAIGVVVGTNTVANNEPSAIARNFIKTVYFGFASLAVFALGWGAAIQARGGG